jgi:hypothetical protein
VFQHDFKRRRIGTCDPRESGRGPSSKGVLYRTTVKQSYDVQGHGFDGRRQALEELVASEAGLISLGRSHRRLGAHAGYATLLGAA